PLASLAAAALFGGVLFALPNGAFHGGPRAALSWLLACGLLLLLAACRRRDGRTAAACLLFLLALGSVHRVKLANQIVRGFPWHGSLFKGLAELPATLCRPLLFCRVLALSRSPSRPRSLTAGVLGMATLVLLDGL